MSPLVPATGPTPSYSRILLQTGLLALGYFAAARFGLTLATLHGNVSPVWPATGVGIGALLLGGNRLWIGVFLGAFVANVLTPAPLAAVLFISGGNTLEALLGAWIVDQCRTSFSRAGVFRDALGYLSSAAIAPSVGAVTGVTSLLLSGDSPWHLVPQLLQTWWTGDALGALLVAPLFETVAIWQRERQALTRSNVGLASVLLVITATLGGIAFFHPSGGTLIFSFFPLILVASGWFGVAGARCCAVLVAATGVVAAASGHGPFAHAPLNQSLLHLQLFLTSVATAALVIPSLFVTGRTLLPGLVMVTGVVLSAGMFSSLRQQNDQADATRFQGLVDAAEQSLRLRLTVYEDALRSGAAFFDASDRVERSSWRKFVERLDLAGRYPGVSGLGYVARVRESEVTDYVRSIRADGSRDFTVRSLPGNTQEPGSDRYIITYVEPEPENATALGLDVATEGTRRQVLEASRDSGEPRMSRRVVLVQDSGSTPGFLLVMPIYDRNVPHETVVDKRATIRGWVYAPFRTREFVETALGGKDTELVMHLYEGDTIEPAAFLCSTDLGGPRENYDYVSKLELAGEQFALGWSRADGFVGADRSAPVLAATSSAFVSLLLALLVISLQSAERRAQSLVQERTAALQAANLQLKHEVQERHQVAATLRQTSLVNQAILGSANYAIISTDPSGIVRTFNRAAERLLGYGAGEVVGIASMDVFHDGADLGRRMVELKSELGMEVPNVFEAIVAKARAGVVDEREWHYVRKDGRLCHVLVSVTALRGEDGTVSGFLAIAADQSARREQEERTRRARDELQRQKFALDEHAIVAVTNVRGRIIYANEKFCAVSEYTKAELLGQRFSVVDARLQPIEQFREMYRTIVRGHVWKGEICNRSKSGRVYWLESTIVPFLNSDGTPAQYVAIQTDVTERRHAAEELRASRERLSSLFNAVTEGVTLLGADGSILECNAAAERILSLNREQLLGRAQIDSAWRTIREDGSPFPVEEYPANVTLKTGQPTRGVVMGVATLERDVTWISTNAEPVLGADGKVAAAICSFTDITERRRDEIALREARDGALEASRLKSEFLATMSHEIRTPMNGVIGMSQLLLQSAQDPRQKQMTEVIVHSATNLLAIINDILDFSKIEAGKMRIVSAPFSLRTAVEETVALLSQEATRKGLTLSCEVDDSLAEPVEGDSGRVQQVLMNLVGNAVKFTERGHVKVSVRLLPGPTEKTSVRVEVLDTGIGISPAMQERLFQPFVQEDATTTRRFGGTGLGLAISAQIVRAMGGTIAFESKEGQGSRFWFQLAFTKAPKPEPRKGRVTRDNHGGGRRLRVLLTEDNPTNQLVARMMLDHLGHSIEIANNGQEAVDWLKRERFDAVLMDCQMPVMDGYEATRRIRTGEAGPGPASVPIIALTAFAMADDRAKAIAVGMDDYVSKPVSMDGLRKVFAARGLTGEAASQVPAGTTVMPSLHNLAANQAVESSRFERHQKEQLTAIKLTDGGTLWTKATRLFAEEMPGRLAQLDTAVRGRDGQKLSALAHTLSGTAANVGARELRTAAQRIGKAAKAEDWAEVEAALAAVNAEWHLIREEMAVSPSFV